MKRLTLILIAAALAIALLAVFAYAQQLGGAGIGPMTGVGPGGPPDFGGAPGMGWGRMGQPAIAVSGNGAIRPDTPQLRRQLGGDDGALLDGRVHLEGQPRHPGDETIVDEQLLAACDIHGFLSLGEGGGQQGQADDGQDKTHPDICGTGCLQPVEKNTA